MMNSLFKIACVTLCFYLLAGCGAPLSQSASQNNQAPMSDGLEVDARKSFADIPIAGGDSIDISRSLLLNSGEQWIGQAVIQSSQSIEAAFSYYSDEMPTYGWSLITSVQSKISVLNYEKGARFASVKIDANDIVVTVSYRGMADD